MSKLCVDFASELLDTFAAYIRLIRFTVIQRSPIASSDFSVIFRSSLSVFQFLFQYHSVHCKHLPFHFSLRTPNLSSPITLSFSFESSPVSFDQKQVIFRPENLDLQWSRFTSCFQFEFQDLPFKRFDCVENWNRWQALAFSSSLPKKKSQPNLVKVICNPVAYRSRQIILTFQ